MILNPGSRLGPYEIIGPLGAGGMGEVYRAQDPRLGREVAIKVLPQKVANDPDARSRFQREVKAVAALSHPNILTIYDVGTEGDTAFAVMELLEGETLRSCLQRGCLAWRQAVEWSVTLAEGLEAAHARGITHRDLKPENIFVTTDSRIKILDFGLARYNPQQTPDDVTSQPTQSRTEPGTVVGTVSYMSPEQVRGEPAQPASDIFSFGSVLWEMVTGRRAFARQTNAETMVAILKEESPEPGPEIPLELQRIIRRCLEKKPEQRFGSARDLALALKALSGSGSGSLATKATAEPGRPTSVAVLPFVDMSPERDQEYFCDGMAEELINGLTKVPGLSVVSRTAAFQFRGKGEDIQKIGLQLKAETVLEGSVRKAGSRLRITAQLIKVEDGYHLWSEKYDREMKDVFEVQDEIAHAIVQKLKLELLGGQAQLIKRYTSNQEAYNLYLKGRHFWNRRSAVGVQKGMQLFQEAIEKDPTYALAYAGLADCYSLLGHYGFAPPKEVFPKARAAAQKALEIDPDLPEGYTSIAMVQLMQLEFLAGEESLRKAISLDPKQAIAYAVYGMHLSVMGRIEEGAENGRIAQELDPLNPSINGWTGAGFLFSRQYERAIEQFEKALEVDPNSIMSLTGLGFVYDQKLMFADAIAMMQKAVQNSRREAYALGLLGMVLGRSGDVAQAKAILAELEERSKHAYVMPLAPALVCVGLGEKDRAIDWLERACEDRNSLLWVLHVAPYYDSLRAEPRFAALLKKLGLDRYAEPSHRG